MFILQNKNWGAFGFTIHAQVHCKTSMRNNYIFLPPLPQTWVLSYDCYYPASNRKHILLRTNLFHESMTIKTYTAKGKWASNVLNEHNSATPNARTVNAQLTRIHNEKTIVFVFFTLL